MTLEEGSNDAESARLAQLLGMRGSLVELNRALAGKIADGELGLQTPGLAAAPVADHDGQAGGRSAELCVV